MRCSRFISWTCFLVNSNARQTSMALSRLSLLSRRSSSSNFPRAENTILSPIVLFLSLYSQCSAMERSSVTNVSNGSRHSVFQKRRVHDDIPLLVHSTLPTSPGRLYSWRLLIFFSGRHVHLQCSFPSFERFGQIRIVTIKLLWGMKRQFGHFVSVSSHQCVDTRR